MRPLNFLITVCLFSILPLSVYAQNWELVWSDEFSGTSLDLDSWTRETGGGGWGNNELQYYTDREVNSFISDGRLIIKAQAESYGGRNYTSARLKTQNKKFWKYGKIEARMKLPYGQGIWPAFWMLGQNISSVGWPACGEIDIMEMIGGSGREKTVHGTVHWDNAGQHAQSGGSYSLPVGTFADAFHVFRIEWDQNLIRWYVDNNHYYSLNITPSGLSEIRNDFFILLNLAVGGNWPGNPNSTTVFPQTLEVDYVRVYKAVLSDVKDESSIPSEYKLEQNFPNPFNPSTTINFSIPEDSFVTLKVWDMKGTEIALLLNDEVSAGNHKMEFIPSNISSQVYVYQLMSTSLVNSRTFTTSKKMIFLK
jgi:beta-glucanase (GH16 family)